MENRSLILSSNNALFKKKIVIFNTSVRLWSSPSARTPNFRTHVCSYVLNLIFSMIIKYSRGIEVSGSVFLSLQQKHNAFSMNFPRSLPQAISRFFVN
jgi:hypothetical protein